jgi:hypothetical protein
MPAGANPATRAPNLVSAVKPHDQHREQHRENQSGSMTMQHIPGEQSGAERPDKAHDRRHAEAHGVRPGQKQSSQRADEQADEEEDHEIDEEAHGLCVPASLSINQLPTPGVCLWRPLARPRRHRSVPDLLDVVVCAELARDVAHQTALKRGADDDACSERVLDDQRDRLEPSHPRHREIQQHDVRLELAAQPYAVTTVVGLAHNRDGRVFAEHHAKDLAHLRKVIADDDADVPRLVQGCLWSGQRTPL